MAQSGVSETGETTRPTWRSAGPGRVTHLECSNSSIQLPRTAQRTEKTSAGKDLRPTATSTAAVAAAAAVARTAGSPVRAGSTAGTGSNFGLPAVAAAADDIDAAVGIVVAVAAVGGVAAGAVAVVAGIEDGESCVQGEVASSREYCSQPPWQRTHRKRMRVGGTRASF